MFQNAEKWNLLVQLHNYCKSLLLKAEELDPKHEFYFPPLIQQRDALDHIVRAEFALIYPDKLPKGKDGNPEPATEYAEKQMVKAIGHAYRAFFDAADWLSIIVRERIRGVLANYTRKTIYSVLPEYAEQLEPRIDQICLEIATLRKGKDIGHEGKVIDGVEQYIALINELEEHAMKIMQAQPRLDKVEFSGTTP